MTERQPGDPLGPSCGHKVHEDCMICFECGKCSESLDDDDVCEECRTAAEPDEPPSPCTGECNGTAGKNWVYTGTAYGGDDPSYFGEGRCYCQFCGADGDG